MLEQSLDAKTELLTSIGIGNGGSAETASTLEANVRRADKLCLMALDSFSNSCRFGLVSALTKNEAVSSCENIHARYDAIKCMCTQEKATNQKLASLHSERGLLA